MSYGEIGGLPPSVAATATTADDSSVPPSSVKEQQAVAAAVSIDTQPAPAVVNGAHDYSTPLDAAAADAPPADSPTTAEPATAVAPAVEAEASQTTVQPATGDALDALAAVAEVNMQQQQQHQEQAQDQPQTQPDLAPAGTVTAASESASLPVVNGVDSHADTAAVDAAPEPAAVDIAPAPISQPETLPPPPVQPLPAATSLPNARPILQHVDSSSSLAAQPPTPAPSSAFAAPASAAPSPQPTPAPVVMQEAQAPAQQSTDEQLSSAAPFVEAAATPTAADPLAHEPTPAPPVAAVSEPAPAPQLEASAPSAEDVKMEDTPAPAPLLKRSAPDDVAGQSAQAVSGNTEAGVTSATGSGAAETDSEREAKRQRVESEPLFQAPAPAAGTSASASALASPIVTSASASSSPAPPAPSATAQTSMSAPPTPAPVSAAPTSAAPQGYDPSAYAASSSLSAAPAPSPTMSPSEMFNQPPPASAPHSASVPPYQAVANAYSQPPAASPAPIYPHSAGPGTPVVHAQPGISTLVAAGQPLYAPAPIPEPFRPQPSQQPGEVIAPMTKDQHKHALSLVRTLKKNRSAIPFLKPVDPVALLIPDYFRVITQPMDLGTVEAKLNATGKALTAASKNGHRIFGVDYSGGQGYWEGASEKVYRTVGDFKADLDRVWQNCFKYNGPPERNAVSAMAQAMNEAAEKGYRTMPQAPQVLAVQDPPVVYTPPPRQHSPQDHKRERRQSHSLAQMQHPSSDFVPTIRRSEDGTRPKREIHAPSRELAYLNDDGSYGGGMGAAPAKSRTGRVSGKQAQEQLRFCKEVIKELFKKTHESYAFPFYEPVNWVALNIPQYPQIIKEPMDLGTIRTKLENGLYPLPPYQAFERDVRLIFDNCSVFNPPGTPVNDWGRRLESVFEDKWSERPMHYYDDDEGPSDDDGITAMERQLMSLQQSIEQMKASKRAEKERMRAAERAMAARAAPKPIKRAPSMEYMPQMGDYGMGHYGGGGGGGRRDSGGAPKKKSGGGGGQKRKKARRSGDSSDEDFYDDGGAYVPQPATHAYAHHQQQQQQQQPPPQAYAQPGVAVEEEMVTFDMKHELANKIGNFEGDALEKAIDIIRQGRPDLLSDANKEIELDIDTLDQRTLLNLYRYVCPQSPVAAGRKPKGTGAGRGGRNGSAAAPTKRKNLDEIKESERIEMLEARLRDFDQPQKSAAASGSGDAAGTPGVPTPGAAGAAPGGDQASSDSSSEDDSGSDSDD